MKATNAPRIWLTPRFAAYTRAIFRKERLDSDKQASHQEHADADTELYTACGAPFGASALGKWVWFEFGQWQTVN